MYFSQEISKKCESIQVNKLMMLIITFTCQVATPSISSNFVHFMKVCEFHVMSTNDIFCIENSRSMRQFNPRDTGHKLTYIRHSEDVRLFLYSLKR